MSRILSTLLSTNTTGASLPRSASNVRSPGCGASGEAFLVLLHAPRQARGIRRFGHEHDHVGAPRRLARRLIHHAPELRARPVKAGRVEQRDLRRAVVHDPEDRVARRLRRRRDDRERMAERRVQQRRFADVGAPDQGHAPGSFRQRGVGLLRPPRLGGLLAPLLRGASAGGPPVRERSTLRATSGAGPTPCPAAGRAGGARRGAPLLGGLLPSPRSAARVAPGPPLLARLGSACCAGPPLLARLGSACCAGPPLLARLGSACCAGSPLLARLGSARRTALLARASRPVVGVSLVFAPGGRPRGIAASLARGLRWIALLDGCLGCLSRQDGGRGKPRRAWAPAGALSRPGARSGDGLSPRRAR